MSGSRTPGAGWATDPIRAAGGRRRYNRQRQDVARERRAEVAELIRTHGDGRGTQAMFAAKLGVSQTTISRDVKAIFYENRCLRCPCCGSAVPLEHVTWSWRPWRAAGSPRPELVYDGDDDEKDDGDDV